MAFGTKNRVRVQVGVEGTAAATRELSGFRGQFDKIASSKGAGMLLQGIGLGAGIGAWGLLTGAVGKATDYLSDAVKMAADEEVGIAKLDAALEANARNWDGNRDAIEDVIREREKLAFSDDEQRDSLAILVARTKDVTKALDLQRDAMDLARLKGISLGDASRALSMALSGSGRALKELGINVSDYTNKEEALTAVRKAAAGQAEAYGATTRGTFESLQITLDDLQEDIGKEMLPIVVELATTFRDDVIPVLRDTTDAIGPLAEGFGFVRDAVALNLNPMAEIKRMMDRDIAAALEKTTAELAVGAEEWDTYAEKTASSREPTEDAGRAIGNIVKPSKLTREELAKLAQSFVDTARTARDNRLDEAYDIAALPLKIAVAKDDVAAAQQDLEEARGSAARNAAALRLLQAKQELDELQNEMKDHREDYGIWGNRLGTAYGRALYNAIHAWNSQTLSDIRRLDNVSVTVRGTNENPERRAAGGPVSGGRPYWVGEEGPELFVPKVAGRVVPTEDLAPSTAFAPMMMAAPTAPPSVPAPLSLSFVYSPTYSSASPAEARQFAASILPELTREMKRQALL